MWTGVSLTTTVIWEDLLWFVAATWQDDGTTDPTVLHKSGRTPLEGADDPLTICGVALRALERELAGGSAAPAPQGREL